MLVTVFLLPWHDIFFTIIAAWKKRNIHVMYKPPSQPASHPACVCVIALARILAREVKFLKHTFRHGEKLSVIREPSWLPKTDAHQREKKSRINFKELLSKPSNWPIGFFGNASTKIPVANKKKF